MDRLYGDGGGSSDSSYQEYQHSASSSVSPNDGASTGRNGVKYCGVCGDIAKSYHFGGLSCDSCKAFFRRSVQNDNYLHFQCCHRGQCVISLSNRKSCQYCRMKRCFAIGMEKSWVMTEEERKALMKARAEKKAVKKTPSMASSSSSPSSVNVQNQNSNSSHADGGGSSPASAATDYEPQIERMIDYMSPLEIKEIECIVTKYMHAYQHVPYRSELRFYDNDRPGVQVMEMFGTLVRRFAFYARLMPDFSSLPFADQTVLLKSGVLEMCLLRGALVFDPASNRWPTANMSMYKNSPILKLDDIGHLTSTRLFQMHLDFISCIQQMSVDEPIIMLLVLIVLFTPERPGLVHSNWIEKYQAYYTSLLEHYMDWRFGPARAKFMFGKMLTKLSDLRELSDTHNHYNLRLGNDEVSSIQNQLNSMKLNPYPELKVIPDDNETTEAAAAPLKVDSCNQQQYTNGYQSSVSPTLNAKEISSCLSEVELVNSAVASPPAAPYQQQDPSTFLRYQNGDMSGISAQQMRLLAQQHMGQHQNGQQQNMALQFMHAMQQSVSQVANAPHFGFEWVKPDYQFDPAVAFADSSSCDMSLKASVVTSSSDSSSPPLTERDMEDLYVALEDFDSKQIHMGDRFLKTGQ